MSHPDPLFDPDNSYEDDMNYDDYNAFFDEDSSNYHPDADHEIASQFDKDDEELEDDWDDFYDDSMDGDHDSAMESCGWGTDEDYGYYGDDTPMYDDYYGGE
jgi:hypothetical protein